MTRPFPAPSCPGPRPARRYARIARAGGPCRVLPLPEIDDPRLDVPTYLRRGLRIPGVNCAADAAPSSQVQNRASKS